MGRIPKSYTVTFPEGLRTTDSPFSVRRSLAQMDNWWLSPTDRGAVEEMPGYAKVNSSEITSATFQSAAVAIKSDGTRMNLIGYTNGAERRIIHMNPDGTTINVFTEATSPAITLGDFSVVVLKDLAIFFNGTDAGFKSTISTTSPTISATGVTRPDVSTGVSVALNAGGDNSVKGIVSYYVSSVSGTTEGALSEEIGPIDCGTGNRVNVTLDDGTGLADGTYRVYRTVADGSEPFFVSQVSVSGATTTYTDDVPDRELGNLPFLNGDVPPAGIISAIVDKHRVWGITASGLLYWSDPDNGESYATTTDGNYIPVNQNDGDVVVALAQDPTGRVVFKENHIYRVIGFDPESLQVVPVTLSGQERRTLGAATRNAITPTDSGLAFYWNRGVYLYVGGQVNYISGEIEDDLSAIRNQDEADGVYMGYFPSKRHLWVSVPLSAGTTPTHTYIFDFNLGKWIGRKTVGFRGFLATEDANGNEQFWAFGASNGFVYKMDTGQTAAGTAISTTLKMAPFFGPGPGGDKHFLTSEVHYAPTSSAKTLTVTNYLDGRTTNGEAASLSMNGSNIDRENAWINWRDNNRGRELQLAFSSNADEPRAKIYGVTHHIHDNARPAP